jgi:hypothetical protein
MIDVVSSYQKIDRVADKLRSSTTGPTIHPMLCSMCGPFNVLCKTWRAAESVACPFCKGHDTTPVLIKEL